MIRNALLAEREARGAGTIAVQLVLTALLHAFALWSAYAIHTLQSVRVTQFWNAMGVINWNRGDETVDWKKLIPSLPPGVEDAATVLLAFGGSWSLLLLLASELFRWVTKARSGFTLFARHLYRAAIAAAVVMPIAAYFVSLMPPPVSIGGQSLVIALFWIYLIAGPSFLARCEMRRPRLSRWRPQCPECGYQLHRLRGTICPECGEKLPTASRAYRRWALRRLTWDRRQRGNLLIAYAKTLLAIVFRPRYAATRLSQPDRMGRALRWAAAHVLILALLSLDALPRWIATETEMLFVHGEEWHSGYSPPLSSILIWSGQTVVAWMLLYGSLPALGVALAWAAPGSHPAARRGRIKWSLYATVVLAVVWAIYCGIQYAAGLSGMTWRGQTALSVAFDVAPPVYDLVAVPYGVWWAIGMASQPYGRRRMGVFAISLLIFAAFAAAIPLILFRVGPLMPMFWG